jgi:ABC-type Na+ efflux pump permease subunit
MGVKHQRILSEEAVTIIEAFLFILFAFVIVFLYIMMIGSSLIAQEAERKGKELEKKIEDLINNK